MDRFGAYGMKLRGVRTRLDIVETARAQAEGVRSSLGGVGGGGSVDATAERYAALIEDAQRLLDEWCEADDMRQHLMECIDMVPDAKLRLVLLTALRDVQMNGRVVKARMARHLGVSATQMARDYEDALAALNETMREHDR